MDEIAEGKIKGRRRRRVPGHAETIFNELDRKHDEIRGVLYEGLREDKIIGKCRTCGSDLMIRKSKKGGRFIGCTGYPDCKFALPLPPTGNIVATNKVCERHGLNHIKIITGGKKPWELGCPECNFEEWQKKKEAKAAEAGTAGTATVPAKKPRAAPKKKNAEEKPPAA
jgi:DNA topoisomerase-1